MLFALSQSNARPCSLDATEVHVSVSVLANLYSHFTHVSRARVLRLCAYRRQRSYPRKVLTHKKSREHAPLKNSARSTHIRTVRSTVRPNEHGRCVTDFAWLSEDVRRLFKASSFTVNRCHKWTYPLSSVHRWRCKPWEIAWTGVSKVSKSRLYRNATWRVFRCQKWIYQTKNYEIQIFIVIGL